MKNFFDAKDEKITEKAFSQSLVISVFSILLCIVALCSITYAWFTGSTSSGNNTLVAGSFDVTVAIAQSADGETATVSDTVAVTLSDGKYTLAVPGKYLVTLTPTESATVKGYCVLKINGTEYCTGVIITEDTKNEVYKDITSPFIFTIVTTEANTEIEIEAHWGVPAAPVIEYGETLTIGEEQTETENNDAQVVR